MRPAGNTRIWRKARRAAWRGTRRVPSTPETFTAPVVVMVADECQELAASGWPSAEDTAAIAGVLRMGRAAGVAVITSRNRTGARHGRALLLNQVREAADAYPASGHDLCLAVRAAHRAGWQHVTVARRAMCGGEAAFKAAERAVTGACPHEAVA